MSVIITPAQLTRKDKREEFINLILYKIRASIGHYERYNDGKIPEAERKIHEEKYQKLTDEIELPENTSNLSLMRRAKKWAGLTNIKGRSENWDDGLAFYPRGYATVLFITADV